MADLGKAHYRRLVEASLLVSDASAQSQRAARDVHSAADPIMRVMGGIEEVERLCAAVSDGDVRSEMLRLALELRGEIERARFGLERSITALRKSTECTNEAASKLRVA